MQQILLQMMVQQDKYVNQGITALKEQKKWFLVIMELMSQGQDPFSANRANQDSIVLVAQSIWFYVLLVTSVHHNQSLQLYVQMANMEILQG